MFDLDAGKLIIIGIVALVVIGPKELPRVMRQVGQAIGKLRRMAADFQGQFMDAMKEADIEDLKKEINAVAESTKAEVNAISDAARIDMNFDPVAEIKDDVTKAIDAEATAIDAVVTASDTVVTAQSTAATALGPALDLALNLPGVPDVPPLAIAAEAEPSPAPSRGKASLSRGWRGHSDTRAPRAEPKASESPLPNPSPLSAGEGAGEADQPKRKPRVNRVAEDAAPEAPAFAGAAPDDGNTRERVPFRKRVAYETGRAARARRDAT